MGTKIFEEYTSCPGDLIFCKGGGENWGDLVYLSTKHDCNTTYATESSLGSRLLLGVPNTCTLLTKIVPNVPLQRRISVKAEGKREESQSNKL